MGEIFNANTNDGSQVCSTYDAQWALHWGGVTDGTVKASAPDCAGSVYGSCDGASNAGDTVCNTEARTAANGYFPLTARALENPFYLDLPFDDVNDSTAYKTRCQVIPWANAAGYAGHCTDQNFSYMKNRWVEITDVLTGNICYGQVEDAGPGQYHDATYVFGTTNAKPASRQYNNAGMDVSPALNGCLGFKELDGESDVVSWRFVDSPPPGPWTLVITTSGVTP